MKVTVSILLDPDTPLSVLKLPADDKAKPVLGTTKN